MPLRRIRVPDCRPSIQLSVTTVLQTVFEPAQRFIDGVSPYGSSLALARSLLALSTLLTVVFTPADALFLKSSSAPTGVVCDAVSARWSLFCTTGGDSTAGLMIVVVVTLAVLSGFLPAVTCIPHWWISWSLNIGSPIRDGGDQVAAVLTLLIIPLAIFDRRRNHWQSDRRWTIRRWWVRSIAWAALVLIWIQASIIYANAAIAKFAVPEWANGTAVWYWIQEPSFRPPPFFGWLAQAAQSSLAGAVLVNYGVLAVELLAAVLLFTRLEIRRMAFPLLLVFHLVIGVMFGLWSFFLSMAALLVLYLRVPRQERTDP